MNQKIKAFFKKDSINGIIKSTALKSLRHRIILAVSVRENSTFTGFLRLPCQFEALSGPVLDFLLADGAVRPLKITVLGCSNGAEAYTVASLLKINTRTPDFMIRAYDIDTTIIAKAKRAVYQPDEVFNNKHIIPDFVARTFTEKDGHYVVNERIAKHVSFDVADALDTRLEESVGTADILLAQNFLFHMKPETAKRAFDNICRLLKPRAALFIDGMDIGLRSRLTRRRNLLPLDYKIEEIHNQARWARGIGWPCSYWGLEPFSLRPEWKRRYATIFLQN